MIPGQIYQEVITLAQAFKEHASKEQDNIANRHIYSRLLSELQYIKKNPNLSIAVFPCKNDLTF